ncbi:MAG: 2-oxoacid:acceptor oxidoreductase subunit alpha [Erysipelothrix sp.]|nr:2-oxoacid:acceptor oxidoreductase subunit alpha [Erysipelothrix sp.]
MRESLSIVLSGEAGQGLQTIEEFLVEALSNEYYVFTSKEVMSRVRGGNNSVEIRVASSPVYALRYTIDYLFLLNNHSFYRLAKRVDSETVVFGEAGHLSDEEKAKYGVDLTTFDLSSLAKQAGSKLYANTILFGYIAGMLDLSKKVGHDLITSRFESRGEKVIQDNINAYDIGYSLGEPFIVKTPIKKRTDNKSYVIMDGNKSLGIGALAGGVNYIASYPMSPGTSLLSFLSSKGEEFGVLAEQAEDEIAALNMTIGAWYAGARGIVTTSGGGFALMTEAVSLAGITENPAVIHVAQRPGPATGLPTRTEQGDLNLVVYAGHGEFPRIVLAPGKTEDGINLAQQAFWLADKYQVPVFILSDQYWLESMSQMEPFELSDKYLETFMVTTEKGYKRYNWDTTISPRGVPGFGEGFVKVDSDEHDEEGQITEDFDVRVRMHEKRLAKRELLLEDYIEPDFLGNKDSKNLVVGWGSTYGVLKELVETSGLDVAMMYVKQPFPLPLSLKEHFKGKNVIVLENNATGQFANILKLELDVKIDSRILKYNGEPFHIEEVETKVKEVLK